MPSVYLAVADDHTLFRGGLISMLNDFPDLKVVIDASDGTELIRKLSEATFLPDICILDLRMKPMNGYETAEEIIKRWKYMKILFLSMFDTQFLAANASSIRVDGFLSKTVDPEILHESLLSIYKGEKIFDNLAHAPKSNLTPSEISFLQLCASEYSIKEIAAIMKVGIRSAENFKNALCRKLGKKTRTGLALFAVENGLT